MNAITVTTDFGPAEGYAGAMMGAILRVAPTARVTVITHALPPHDVLRGAFVLATAAPHFPRGTVHLAVVDPGVGSERRGIVLSAGKHLFVGPDNGLFSDALEGDPDHRAWCIDAGRLGLGEIHPTFHGRDVFAPVAARLALGSLEPSDVGPPIADPLRWHLQPAREAGGKLVAAILHVDVFGNVVTNVRREAWAEKLAGKSRFLTLRGEPLRLVRTYAQAREGELVALWGSSGRLELALREARADRALGVDRGESLAFGLEEEAGRL